MLHTKKSFSYWHTFKIKKGLDYLVLLQCSWVVKQQLGINIKVVHILLFSPQ